MENNKNYINIGNGINYFIAISLIISGILKLVGFPPYSEMIADLSPHYYSNIYLLGIIAICSGVLLLFSQTFTFGFITTLVFLGGTVSAHMQHGDNFIPQIIFISLMVLAAYFKRKAWFTSPTFA